MYTSVNDNAESNQYCNRIDRKWHFYLIKDSTNEEVVKNEKEDF